MNVNSEATWIKVANNGFSRPNAARAMRLCLRSSSVEVLQNDSPAIPGDANSLYKLAQVIADQHHICALAGQIRSCSHRNADRSLTQGWCIVDPIAQHGNRTALFDLFGDKGSLLLRQ